MANQRETILEHLKDVGNISGMEAWNMYKVRSLTSRIAQLRQQGYQIDSQWKIDHTGQRYVRYKLLKKKPVKKTAA